MNLLIAQAGGAAAGTGAPWWCLLAGAVGFVAGFQGIYERYSTESPRLMLTLSGAGYLLTRAAVPAALFLVIPANRLPNVPPAFLASAVGVASEGILRLRFFVRNKKDDKELLFGPFDLLRWYQELFLGRMGVAVGKWREKSARDAIPPITFPELRDRVSNRLVNIQDEGRQTLVAEILTKVSQEYDAAAPASERDQHFKERLAYRIRNAVDQATLAMLIEEPE